MIELLRDIRARRTFKRKMDSKCRSYFATHQLRWRCHTPEWAASNAKLISSK